MLAGHELTGYNAEYLNPSITGLVYTRDSELAIPVPADVLAPQFAQCLPQKRQVRDYVVLKIAHPPFDQMTLEMTVER